MKILLCLCALVMMAASLSLAATVTTLIGTGKPGFSDSEVNNPYGLAIGPDGALYFCDLDNSRIRKIDLSTKKVTTIAGTGQKGYKGDGGPALEASLNMPHELLFDAKGDLYIAERDNHVIRKVDLKTGIITTAAGTGMRGFAGDGGPGVQAQFNQPHSIVLDRDGSMLICETKDTPEGAPVKGTPVTGPRTIVRAANGDLYLALREGNAIYRIDAKTQTYHRLAGTGELGFSGDGGPALQAKFGGSATGNAARLAGPKGLALGSDDSLYVADTESHAVRKINLKTGIITTVLGTGQIGDGPEPDPLKCKLNRPHSVVFAKGVLYVGDSEAHRILTLR
jgi:DNA-binding beta-propeller fold protein YncE